MSSGPLDAHAVEFRGERRGEERRTRLAGQRETSGEINEVTSAHGFDNISRSGWRGSCCRLHLRVRDIYLINSRPL